MSYNVWHLPHGGEPLSYRQYLERFARAAGGAGPLAALRIREVSIEEADAQAAAGGYRGMRPDELDCLLCDEVADPGPLEALLGRFLTPLDDAVAFAAGRR